MGEGEIPNTRLRTLDADMKQVQQQIAAHDLKLDTISATVHDILTQLSLQSQNNHTSSPNPTKTPASTTPPSFPATTSTDF